MSLLGAAGHGTGAAAIHGEASRARREPRQADPLQLAITGGVHWASESPTAIRNPKLGVYLNGTAQVLLTPHEYFKTRARKTATDREKTWAKAYDKAAKQLGRVAEGDATLRSIVAMPMPNVPLLGSYALVLGVLLAPLVGGMEYLVVGGCLLILQGTRSFGMEPQPDLYVTGAVAVVALVLLDLANKKVDYPKRKRR
jgi:hypothetical protein